MIFACSPRRRATRSAVLILLTLAASSVAAAQPTAATPAPTNAIAPASPETRAALDAIAQEAAELPALRTLIVTQHGQPLLERAYQGANLDTPVNIKSASKSIISAMVGRAIAEGLISGVDSSIRPLLSKRLPADANPRLGEITVEDLLTMRAGLARTSGSNYGRWVASRNWVSYAVSQPFVDEPGGNMLYSTGSSHLLSAILTDASGRSTRVLAREWFGDSLGMEIGGWDRDPQGIYLGGNNMAISPRALLRFGEMMRNGGTAQGQQVVPESYIDASWQPRTHSPFTGHDYGYGWFLTEAHGHPIRYAWGYGGQLLYIVPSLSLTVVMTSDPAQPSGRNGYAQQLHALLAERIIPALAVSQ